MIDRLVHHAEVASLRGDFDRLKDRDLSRPRNAANDDHDQPGGQFHLPSGVSLRLPLTPRRAASSSGTGWRGLARLGRARLSVRRCAPCVPHTIMTMIKMHTMHREPPATHAAPPPGATFATTRSALTTTPITKLLTNPLPQSRSTADADDQSPPHGRSTTRTDCRWHGRGEVRLLSPHLLRRLSDIRPQHAPTVNARGCWDRRSPWRGWFTLQHPAP
jgi:hypothetical protein